MSTTKEKLWPYKKQLAFLAIPLVWIGYLLAFAAGERMGAWTGEVGGQTAIIVAILSVIPLSLVIIDFFALSGAVVEIKGVKIDFSSVQETAKGGFNPKGFEIPQNAGVPGVIVQDSGPMKIQETLVLATDHRVVVVNLADGNAWWVTRLLLLCSGATRLGSPDVIVFEGTVNSIVHTFLGYARPAELLKAILSEKQYKTRYEDARAATDAFLGYRYAMRPYPTPALPVDPAFWPPPATPVFASPAAQRYIGQPDYMNAGDEVEEQILLDHLRNAFLPGGSLETTPDLLKVSRLDQLFIHCLRRDTIDLEVKEETQMNQLFAAAGEYVALVRKGVYVSLLKKRDGEELILRQLALPREEK